MKVNRFLLAGTIGLMLAGFGCGGATQPSQQNNLSGSGATQNTGSAGVPTPPGQATNFSALQSSAGWESCNGADCAGGSGTGSYWMAQNQTAPSISGGSTELSNSGVWGNALWWKKLNAV